MDLATLYTAIDERPFRPFVVQLTSGEKINVTHPDNIFVLPSRHKVRHIEVFGGNQWGLAMFGPEAMAAILFDDAEKPSSP